VCVCHFHQIKSSKNRDEMNSHPHWQWFLIISQCCALPQPLLPCHQITEKKTQFRLNLIKPFFLIMHFYAYNILELYSSPPKCFLVPLYPLIVPFLFWNSHLSTFHVLKVPDFTYKRKQATSLFLSGLFHLALWSLVTSIWLQMTWFHSFLWLSNTPLFIYVTFCLTVYL
jgi:hypothetical protein